MRLPQTCTSTAASSIVSKAGDFNSHVFTLVNFLIRRISWRCRIEHEMHAYYIVLLAMIIRTNKWIRCAMPHVLHVVVQVSADVRRARRTMK